jgi:Peptide N-acetyl-beta-D-glucosaminyl asparaginase amidase A
MRALLGAGLLLALLVVVPSVPVAGGTPPALPGPGTTPSISIAHPLVATSHPSDRGGVSFVRPVDSATVAGNRSTPQAGGPPNSAVFANPPPKLPPTTPVIVTVAANTTGCCSYLDFAAPIGPFALIELNYTGTAYGSVYDSSYRAYVNGVPILFGTTPEFGRWVVLKDLTEYSSLFQGTVNVTFLLSAAIISGSFTSTVTVAFYPEPTGEQPPTFANAVLPIWTPAYVKPGVPMLSANVTVPSNATNATLELYAYGFSADEFWYASEPTESAFRMVQVSVDGSSVATILPFPYLNTGGLDLYLWRPIPATFTLNDRPYRVDLSAALGQLEGTHAISVTVVGRDSASPWLVMGGLFLTTSKSTAPAVTSSDIAPMVVDHTTTPAGNVYDNLGTVAYSFASTLAGPGGATNVSTQVVERFVNNETVPTLSSSWDNITGRSTMTFWTNVTSPTGSRSSGVTYDFIFGVDIGGSFVETSNTGGGYPIYGNFTSFTLNLVQAWNETGFSTSGTNYALDERIGGSGVYAGREERISANAAQILSITFIQSQTTEEYLYRSVDGTLTNLADHLLVGSSYRPPGPNSEETITVDRWDTPLASVVVPSVSATDVGRPLTFTAMAVGGRGGIAIAWIPAVPAGCSSTPSPFVLTCRPTVPGTLAVEVQVSDAAGDAPTVSRASVLVLADPLATISSTPSVADVGMTFTVTPTIAGGLLPFSCAWTIAGGTPGHPGSCSSPQSVPANATGLLGLTLTVADASGGSWSYAFNLTVNPLPAISIVTSGAPPSVGSGVELGANITGGTAPFVVSWSVSSGGSAAKSAGSGTVILYTPPADGVYAFTATVVDAVGRSAGSATFNVTVAPAASPATGASGATLPLWGVVGLVAALAVEAIALVALLVLRQQDRRQRRPRAPRAKSPVSSPKAAPDWEE